MRRARRAGPARALILGAPDPAVVAHSQFLLRDLPPATTRQTASTRRGFGQWLSGIQFADAITTPPIAAIRYSAYTSGRIRKPHQAPSTPYAASLMAPPMEAWIRKVIPPKVRVFRPSKGTGNTARNGFAGPTSSRKKNALTNNMTDVA
mgnify:CR=1 FL=1